MPLWPFQMYGKFVNVFKVIRNNCTVHLSIFLPVLFYLMISSYTNWHKEMVVIMLKKCENYKNVLLFKRKIIMFVNTQGRVTYMCNICFAHKKLLEPQQICISCVLFYLKNNAIFKEYDAFFWKSKPLKWNAGKETNVIISRWRKNISPNCIKLDDLICANCMKDY